MTTGETPPNDWRTYVKEPVPYVLGLLRGWALAWAEAAYSQQMFESFTFEAYISE